MTREFFAFQFRDLIGWVTHLLVCDPCLFAECVVSLVTAISPEFQPHMIMFAFGSWPEATR